MNLLNVSVAVDDFFWSQIMIYGCLGAGIFFSVLMRFPQLRLIKDMVAQLFGGKASSSGVSSFQGFAMALGGRVGTGNITGVASAIFFGGPGAVFWMWAIAFLGAGSAYIESALSQVWKEEVHGEYRGGPAYYIEKGLKSRPLGIAFAILTVFGCGMALPGIQTNAFAQAAKLSLGMESWMSGLLYTVIVAYVVFGGGRRIAKSAERIVPFMAVAYILVAMVILVVHYDRIVGVFELIFSSAFNMNAVYGAVFGKAVQWGVKRGIFSNEAGQGTGAQASGAAEVSHPAKQGLVQAFSVYVDTLFVCSATAFMILLTGFYNVAGPDGSMIYAGLAGVEAGPGYTQAAVEAMLPGFGSTFVAVALFFFAFTTILAYYYIAETNVAYINRTLHQPWLMFLLKVVLLSATLYGCVRTASVAWGLGDIGVGLMAWLNLVAILLLQKPALLALADYEAQRRAGLDPQFHPERLGIRNADYWQGTPATPLPEHAHSEEGFVPAKTR